ncbi:MAG TPA: GNAT family N-acetyltransferase [Pseudonocardiaceae bacterium]|jgi:ribosomal protein S18 acetylase RimI-like enzyme
MTAKIRPFADGDWAAVYDICVATAGAGQGVRGRYSTDDLVPDTAAGPYLFLEPQHAYVLDDGERAVGYVIGTADTAGFVAGYRARWLPRLVGKYRPLSGPPVTEEDRRIDTIFHPERLVLPELVDHPAHLHVNLLADQRGSGHGRELIETFLASVAEAGAESCYLMVRRANVNAQGFYARLGWQPIEVPSVEPDFVLIHPTR